MKEIWTMVIRTSLPNVAERKDDIKTTVFNFENFEDAKKFLREKIKEFAFNKNSMFDGNGSINNLRDYYTNHMDETDEENVEDDELLTIDKVKCIEKNLLNIFEGKDCPLDKEEVEYCTDWMISLEVGKDHINLYGDDDGPCNGYNPTIKTNMFDMKKEKDYYLYIDDLFGQDFSTELYIDLIKTELL